MKDFWNFIKKYALVFVWIFVGVFIVSTDNVNTLNYICCWICMLVSMVANKQIEEHCDFWREEAFELLGMLIRLTKQDENTESE